MCLFCSNGNQCCLRRDTSLRRGRQRGGRIRRSHTMLTMTFALNICLLTIANGFQWLLIHESDVKHWNTTDYDACNKATYLTDKQKQVCRKYKSMMTSITEGVTMALDECQHQFLDQPFNCSTRGRRRGTSRQRAVFRDMPSSGTRQAAFIHAIVSAGVVIKVTQDCGSDMIENCGCDESWPPRYNDEPVGFEWGGCSANVAYGKGISRLFVDAGEKGRKRKRNRKRAKNEMIVNLRNNEVGRTLVDELMRRVCSCHGLSGACTIKTCWRRLPDFKVVSTELKKSYLNAVQVHVTENNNRAVAKGKGKKWIAGHRELLYLRRSLKFCQTHGRVCKPDSSGPTGCKELCCNRGYHVVRQHTTVPCNCVFHWCCTVKCDECNQTVTEHRCL